MSADEATVGTAEHLIVVIGTPVDEHLNPDPQAVVVRRRGRRRPAGRRPAPHPAQHGLPGGHPDGRAAHGPPGQVHRRRLLPRADRRRSGHGGAPLAAPDCGRPDRPGLRPGRGPVRHLTKTIIRVDPEEAELAKLFTNSYRYIKFAAANQLFMMANDFGLDYERIRAAVVEDYPRAADLPGPGFAAGPCLLKDTMQLAAFNNNNFALGLASMQINEGLPLYLVSRMAARYDLDSMTVGILGMAFKGESDDNRSSLSYKLKRVLNVRLPAF